MSTAKNRKHYIEAWEAHINGLSSMFMTADAEYKDWDKARDALEVVLGVAADKAFPEGEMEGTLPDIKEAK